jgi:DNA-binding transcriptional ArsR family regulator
LVLNEAQGSPYLVQMYGDSAWRHANPQPGGTISYSAAHAGLGTARHELHTGLFRGRWNRATAAERDFMTAMVHSMTTGPTAAISDIAAALGKPQTQISYLRGRLLDKGLITAPSRGRLAFTMTGFDHFISEETG